MVIAGTEPPLLAVPLLPPDELLLDELLLDELLPDELLLLDEMLLESTLTPPPQAARHAESASASSIRDTAARPARAFSRSIFPSQARMRARSYGAHPTLTHCARNAVAEINWRPRGNGAPLTIKHNGIQPSAVWSAQWL
jgi:hypothetical protein